jgi:hypothetical protein
MQSLAKGKQLFMLTATPINNRLIDLQHLIEHFTQRDPRHFKDTLGIHSLPGHFRKLEKDLAKRMGGDLIQGELPGVETGDLLAQDNMFRELVVQRSRAYVKQSQITAGAKEAMFPKREAPKLPNIRSKRPTANCSPAGKSLQQEAAAVHPAHVLPLGLLQGAGGRWLC